jgi:hypothetical protein
MFVSAASLFQGERLVDSSWLATADRMDGGGVGGMGYFSSFFSKKKMMVKKEKRNERTHQYTQRIPAAEDVRDAAAHWSKHCLCKLLPHAALHQTIFSVASIISWKQIGQSPSTGLRFPLFSSAEGSGRVKFREEPLRISHSSCVKE